MVEGMSATISPLFHPIANITPPSTAAVSVSAIAANPNKKEDSIHHNSSNEDRLLTQPTDIALPYTTIIKLPPRLLQVHPTLVCS